MVDLAVEVAVDPDAPEDSYFAEVVGSGSDGPKTLLPDARMSMERKVFAGLLTELRRRKGLSIRSVSQRAEVPVGTLSSWFAGTSVPRDEQGLRDVLSCLEVPQAQQQAWVRVAAQLRAAPRAAAPDRPLRELTGLVDDAAGEPDPARRDAQEFRQFYLEHARQIFKYGLTLARGDVTEAADLAQVTMVELWTAWPRMRKASRDHRLAMAHRIARNRMIDRWRKTARTVYVPPDDLHGRGVASPSSEGYEVAVAHELAEAILRNLTPAQREVMLRVFDGHPATSIAEELGMTRKAVDNHLSRARTTIRDMLTPVPDEDLESRVVPGEHLLPSYIPRLLAATAGLSDAEIAQQHPEIARLLRLPQALDLVVRDTDAGS